MTPSLTVEKGMALRSFLRFGLPGWKAGTVRRRLRQGLILLDGKAVRRDDIRLAPGQVVEILSRPDNPAGIFPAGLGEPPLELLYADSALIAVNKPSGLLSVASERERERTAVRLMRDWLGGLKRDDLRELHAAHRLDRDASGILLFARSLDVRRRLVADWRNFEKKYLAVTDGVPPATEGSVEIPLREDKCLFVHMAGEGGGEKARTRYRLLKSSGGRSLLEVSLDTGRKHQIRVHLAHIGCPITGDRRYGGSKAPRLALHAAELRLVHPDSRRSLIIRAPAPPVFSRLLRPGRGNRTPRRNCAKGKRG
jgi:23S rRNA pseudouridine1911/1915/1917 synthase